MSLRMSGMRFLNEESHIKCEFLWENHTVYDYIANEKGRSKKIEESEFQIYQTWNGHGDGAYRK